MDVNLKERAAWPEALSCKPVRQRHLDRIAAHLGLLMDDAAQNAVADDLARGATAAITRTPVVDDARVTGIRAALAAGAYRINPQRIAERLVQDEALARGARHKTD